MITLIRPLLAAVAVLSACSPAAFGQLPDTAWPKYQRDLRNSGCAVAVGPNDATVKWVSKIPMVSGGTTIGWDGEIYVHGGHPARYSLSFRSWVHFSALMRVDASGELVWERPITSASVAVPCLSGTDTVYAWDPGNHLGANLYSYSADGRYRWGPINVGVYETRKQLTVGLDGTLYCPGEGALLAFNSDGSLRWSYRGNFKQCPSIGADGVIYLGRRGYYSPGGVLALNPDGTLKWYVQTSSTFGCRNTSISKDGTIYSLSYDQYEGQVLYAILPDGTVAWERPVWFPNAPSGAPTIAPDGTLHFAMHDDVLGQLVALSPEDGGERWRIDLPGPSWAPPIVDGAGNVYVLSGDDLPSEQQSMSYDRDGNLRWSFWSGHFESGTPTMGSDGTLYFFARVPGRPHRHLVALGPGPGPHRTPPRRLETTAGTVITGGVEALKASDDVYVTLASAPSGDVQRCVVGLEQIVPGREPLELGLELECHADQPGVAYEIALYDDRRQRWDTLSTGQLLTDDEVVAIGDVANAERHINDRFRAKVRVSAAASRRFQLRLDEHALTTAYP